MASTQTSMQIATLKKKCLGVETYPLRSILQDQKTTSPSHAPT